MTRIGFIADAHIWNFKRFKGPTYAGINRRAQDSLNALERAVKLAGKLECEALVSLGDLFDGVGPSPQLIAAVQDRIDRAPQFIALRGNHEMESDLPGDHSLAPLFPLAEIIDRPTREDVGGIQLLLIPFERGPASEWLPAAFDKLPKTETRAVRIACIHLGIQDEETPEFLRGAHDSIPVRVLRDLLDEHRINWCAAGNWHDHKVWGVPGREIVQVGTLAPTGFDNPGLEHFGWMSVWGDDWDGDFGFRHFRIPGPRFLKVRTRSELDHLVGERVDDEVLYVEWVVSPDDLEASRAILREMVSDGVIEDGEAVPDKSGVEAATRDAARAARSVDELGKKLAAYVGEMDLPAGVTQEEVIASASNYLAIGV